MCLILKKRFQSEKEAKRAFGDPHIAKSDKIVYKALGRQLSKNRYKAPYRDFIFERGTHYYQVGKQFTSRVTLDSDDCRYYRLKIDRGLHACLTKKVAQNKGHVERMIIPKGAKYFIGKFGDIVTNQLIFPHGK